MRLLGSWWLLVRLLRRSIVPRRKVASTALGLLLVCVARAAVREVSVSVRVEVAIGRVVLPRVGRLLRSALAVSAVRVLRLLLLLLLPLLLLLRLVVLLLLTEAAISAVSIAISTVTALLG